jgi:hypothetical protein
MDAACNPGFGGNDGCSLVIKPPSHRQGADLAARSTDG